MDWLGGLVRSVVRAQCSSTQARLFFISPKLLVHKIGRAKNGRIMSFSVENTLEPQVVMFDVEIDFMATIDQLEGSIFPCAHALCPNSK